MLQTFVKSFTHLKDRPHADRALPMLQRVAALVKPIMRKHGWILPLLSEFFPDSPNLVGLNVNGGEQILLRLRMPWAPDTFYEEDQVVRIMLHELTHNVHGPHDEIFYKFLAALEDEYDTLVRSGYAGEGFFSPGQRLGAGVSHDLPPHIARLRALEAAEKRNRTNGVLGSGGRLGGRVTALQGMNPRELAAQAAERRKRDEIECGSGTLAQREAERAAKESIEDIIDLTDNSPLEPWSCPLCTLHNEPIVLQCAACFTVRPFNSPRTASQPRVIAGPSRTHDNTSTSGSTSDARGQSRVLAVKQPSNFKASSDPTPHPRKPAETSADDGQWSCAVCTLVNDKQTNKCTLCLTGRPQVSPMGWTCIMCGEADMPHQFWSCRFCGAIKTESTYG
ncbi:WLM domain-containing protein [Suillus clintonianus]|uniref:WLM domain-containing protein n=1 Tax=Suillus clintonianus TaxID=1904413 RepID=UPI001B86926B|nr:WLM domain-containing protein [Suillus clintonianus]KAG2155682.1 WLM domain-containing protein [Suillus clintonianus]